MKDNTPPSTLPSSLPAGTLFVYYDATWVAQETMALDEAGLFYWGKVTANGGGSRDGKAQARLVDWSSVTAPQLATPVEARPIRAGDWVECVRATGSGAGLTVGQRRQVGAAFDIGGEWKVAFVGVEFFWLASRFKRVDGPHPETSSSGATGTGNAPSVASGEVKPTCSECGAVAPLLASFKCEYCDKRKLCDARIAALTDEDRRMVEPRKRLAAIEQRERPRVTATRTMLDRGHPVCWPSNEGEDL